MTVQDLVTILGADVISGEERMEQEISYAFSSDMMSDVLAFANDQAVMVTGLVNPQVIRTAEMVDMVCIIFVRGKMPDANMIALAKERGIALISTKKRMFTTCGLLYAKGLRGGSDDQ